jgi:hypothetical protein
VCPTTLRSEHELFTDRRHDNVSVSDLALKRSAWLPATQHYHGQYARVKKILGRPEGFDKFATYRGSERLYQ